MIFTIYRLALLFSVLCWVKSCQAFCVYNTFTDGTLLYVHQYDNFGGDNDRKFRAEIQSGEKACCNWSDPVCNVLGAKMAPTRFVIWTAFSNYGRIELNMLYLLSDGYAKVGGDPANPTIDSYFADDGRYTYNCRPTTEDYSDYF